MNEDTHADEVIFKLYDDLSMKAPKDGTLYRALLNLIKSERAAAAQAEREACSKIAEEACITDPEISEAWLKSSNDKIEQVAFTHADKIAAAIRARSEATE